jgi:dihydrodipicolinate synthase/N-acetylneuraminate lyase
MSKRYRQCILATCCVPWREDFTFDEALFRAQVRHLIAGGIRDLYTFGTAGEGYAVTERHFDEITRAFLDETQIEGVQTMTGLISLSLPTLIERIERARDMGVRRFQLSLPSWGKLSDKEVAVFFRETCGRFPDCEFLHYNLMRTHRILTPKEYGVLAQRHPNLVATKNSTTDLERLRGLLAEAPQLQHFITEGGFADAAMMDECGLLISLANTNIALGHAYLEAGKRRDESFLKPMQRESGEILAELLALAQAEAHMDGAFDKMFIHMHLPDFSLRLLPPYAGVSEATMEHFARLLERRYPRWSPAA